MGIKERIEALQPDCHYDCDWQDLRDRAAKEAAEADELMAEMADTIEMLRACCTDTGADSEAAHTLHLYNQFKNQIRQGGM